MYEYLWPVIYINFHLLKKKSDSKSTLCYHWTWSRCMSLTKHFSTSFIISFFKQLIQNQLSNNTATVVAKVIYWELILKKVIYKKITPSYHFFCKTKWRRSGAQVNKLVHFVLSFSTAIPNCRYHGSKTLKISVVCIILFITLCRA